MNENILQVPRQGFIGEKAAYRYGVYAHKLSTEDGIVYTRYFIVVKNSYNIIVRFTNLHNYAEVYENKVFAPITSDAKTKLHYICKMLNYVLIARYSDFHTKHVFDVNQEMLVLFFQDYAMKKMPNGRYRSEQSIERCVHTVTAFFWKLVKRFGGYMQLSKSDLYKEEVTRNKYGKIKRKLPAFQVRGFPQISNIFRELPTKAFRILLNLAFRYAPEIAFAICLQAFAGLRAGEVCNVRQEGSPAGNGIVFTYVADRVIKAEIDLTRELPLRSDGVICGKIKKERRQCVYPPFLEAFVTAYEHHKIFLDSHSFEKEYCPMFVNNRGMAMTYDNYVQRFRALVDNHFRAVLLESDDSECRLYGQLLYENRLGSHALRHWFSVQLVLHGEDIAQIQYWRGDKNPESAFLYLQNKGDLARELASTNEFLTEMLLARGEAEFHGKQ